MDLSTILGMVLAVTSISVGDILEEEILCMLSTFLLF